MAPRTQAARLLFLGRRGAGFSQGNQWSQEKRLRQIMVLRAHSGGFSSVCMDPSRDLQTSTVKNEPKVFDYLRNLQQETKGREK
jgi:hypothetical protein